MTELDTFVKKFNQLWKDGVTAHLDLDTHAGDAWVGLRVRLGHVPGPLHRPVHPVHQEVPRKESPSRQRRRARRAAARQTSGNATEREAVKANEIVQEPTEAQKVVEDAAVDHEGEEPVVEVNVKEVTDEFCSNAEFIENILSEENSVSFRMIVKDTDDIQVFKNKVRNSFFTADVDIVHQHFEISGLETLPDQIKFYLKVINDKKAIEAILNLKSDNILLMKIPKKKPK